MKKFFCYGKKDFCDKDGHCNVCDFVDNSGGEYREVPETIADRIRAMSDEELLGYLLELQDIAIKRFANFEPPNYQWMADWLQQPAEEDDHA